MTLQELRALKSKYDKDLTERATMALERIAHRLVEVGLPVEKVICGNGVIVFDGPEIYVTEDFGEGHAGMPLHDALLRMNKPLSAWHFSRNGANTIPVCGETLHAIRDAVDIVLWCEHRMIYPEDIDLT